MEKWSGWRTALLTLAARSSVSLRILNKWCVSGYLSYLVSLCCFNSCQETKLMNSHSNSDRLNEEVIELKRQLEAAADDNAQNMSQVRGVNAAVWLPFLFLFFVCFPFSLCQILTSANEATSARSEVCSTRKGLVNMEFIWSQIAQEEHPSLSFVLFGELFHFLDQSDAAAIWAAWTWEWAGYAT